jgi:hypothetical protein
VRSCSDVFPHFLVRSAAGNATYYGGLRRIASGRKHYLPFHNDSREEFCLDSATVNGAAMSNAKTRMAEAYTCTGTCVSQNYRSRL